MIRFPHLTALLALPIVSGSPVAARPVQAVAPPPPPIVSVSSARTLLRWEPGEARCDGAVVSAQMIRRPWNQLGWSSGPDTHDVSLRFAIDASGRPVSITRETKGAVPFGEDLAPALTASRFAAQAPHTNCTITYTMRQSPLAGAPLDELMSYSVHPLSGRLPDTGWERIRQGAGDCMENPQPQPLERHFPDFAAIPATPGVRDWSMIRYDVDAAGKVKGASVLTGTGNRALDAAGVKAIRASRFTKGARSGCLYPYWKEAATLPAPDMPEAIRTTKVEGNCPDKHGWAVPPQLRFPEPYRRRAIEGWAVIRYDVASWGETGNWTVIDAQPSADFGDQAIAMLRAARLPATPQGFTGCVDRIRFTMGPATGGRGGEGGVPTS
ncbi:energy transducer TonB [Sphingomonas sp. PB1R3]|uniref:energy transducer TonB n=1 Tax=Sphingomonas flavida TaxID=3096154 RepID=UPI002FC684F4